MPSGMSISSYSSMNHHQELLYNQLIHRLLSQLRHQPFPPWGSHCDWRGYWNRHYHFGPKDWVLVGSAAKQHSTSKFDIVTSVPPSRTKKFACEGGKVPCEIWWWPYPRLATLIEDHDIGSTLGNHQRPQKSAPSQNLADH